MNFPSTQPNDVRGARRTNPVEAPALSFERAAVVPPKESSLEPEICHFWQANHFIQRAFGRHV
jgi:hypothetical protein